MERLPKVITHKQAGYWRKRLSAEPEMQCGYKGPMPGDKWYDQIVTLEFPMGEIAENGIKTLALVGMETPQVVPLTGKESFNAQGLEGKIQVRKRLINALLNLDIIPEFRGRIVTR